MTKLITVSVPAVRPYLYPAIYESRPSFSGAPRYGINLEAPPIEKLDPQFLHGIHQTVPKDGSSYKSPYIRAGSKYAPEVFVTRQGQEYPYAEAHDQLAKELNRLHARNLPFDRIFENRPLLVVISRYYHTTDEWRGFGIGLERIGVEL